MGDQHFLNIEQIIPTKDVDDFMIGIADKSLDEVEGATEEKNRHRVRREFWTGIIKVISGKTGLHQNISPSSQGWISAGSGVRGVVFSLAASRTYGRAEVYIDRGDGEENMFISDQFLVNATRASGRRHAGTAGQSGAGAGNPATVVAECPLMSKSLSPTRPR